MSALTTEPQFLLFPFGQTGQHLHLRGGLDLTDKHDFGLFCDDNKDWRIERTAHGELVIEMPTKGSTGAQNALLTAYLTMSIGSGKLPKFSATLLC